MGLLKSIGAGLLIIGLIYFILNSAYKTYNYRKKALYFFIIGLIITLVFGGAMIKDLVIDKANIDYSRYFILPIANILYCISFVSGYLSKGKYQKHISFKRTVTNKENYLYIVYKYQNYFLLKKDKNDFIGGDIVKFSHSIYFHDEMIGEILKSCPSTIQNKEFYGTVSVQKKIKYIYYCYIVEVGNIEGKLEDYATINPYQLINYKCNEFDKQILYRLVIKEKIDINIGE